MVGSDGAGLPRAFVAGKGAFRTGREGIGADHADTPTFGKTVLDAAIAGDGRGLSTRVVAATAATGCERPTGASRGDATASCRNATAGRGPTHRFDIRS